VLCDAAGFATFNWAWPTIIGNSFSDALANYTQLYENLVRAHNNNNSANSEGNNNKRSCDV
jgi:hypothetical protein